MENHPVLRRLDFSPEEDFLRLWDSYLRGTFKIVPGPMEKHFSIARSKPAGFLNHPPVLGVSIGGSNTKLMIAERKRGELIVHFLEAFPNPAEPTPMEVYWDRILIANPQITDYLHGDSRPLIGFSIPVPMLQEGVFFHISKVPGITGLIARDLERDAPSHHFGRNMHAYLADRGIEEAELFYYSDTVVAHHGGMSTSPLDPLDKSILLVSGTGLATCDEGNFVLTGQAPILMGDEELYPQQATEGWQYQFVGAGKGIHGVMSRAIEFAATDLPAEQLLPFFTRTPQSVHVYDLWRAAEQGQPVTSTVESIRRLVGADQYRLLGMMAAKIMDRTVSCIANSGVLTTVHMGRPASGRGHHFFFEGGITTAPLLLPRIKDEMRRMIAQRELFAKIGAEAPPDPVTEVVMLPASAAPGAEINRDALDLSVTGAVTAAMAQNLIVTRG